MSSQIFFHKPSELNWKLWLTAATLCISTAAAANLGKMENGKQSLFETLTMKANEAERAGDFRKARRDFDLALLKARSAGKKRDLVRALLNCTKIDLQFEEFDLAEKLAREAFRLSSEKNAPDEKSQLDSMLTLADATESAEQSLLLYKKALPLLEKQHDDRRVAQTILEIAACYLELQDEGAASSACKASLARLEKCGSKDSLEYAGALAFYANLPGISPEKQEESLREALRMQESKLGIEHPDLSETLKLLSASASEPGLKLNLLERAKRIDEKTFGAESLQFARDLCLSAELYEDLGKQAEAEKCRKQAAANFARANSSLQSLSCEFLLVYEQTLRQLKFEREADRIAEVISSKGQGKVLAESISAENARRGAFCQDKDTKQGSGSKSESESESASEYASESDPEFWQRTELLSIEGIENFSNSNYDYIQVWYKEGELELDVYCAGEIAWKKVFGNCPSGIVNLSADQDMLTVSWRDGDGPVWHTDRYRLGHKSLNLVSSQIVDAYAQQMDEQLEAVLNGDDDAIEYGAVETAPSCYINNNFIADALAKGERKALKLYGLGDSAAAAARLAAVFDLTTRAINSKRSQLNPLLSREESWLEALKFQGQPRADYITALNDYGFFLQQCGCLKESVPVLKLVVELSPERSVAHLNLADSLWGMGKQTDARSAYQNYLKALGLSGQIKSAPRRVSDRLCPPLTIKLPLGASPRIGV